MRLVKPSFTIEHGTFGDDALRLIESAARTCYKSECRGDPASFVRKIVHQYHHESVIEHVGCTVRFVVDRGVSHELVRHRVASFSQESTRYVDYGEDGKTGGHCTFVIPPWVDAEEGIYDEVVTTDSWVWAMHLAETYYRAMRREGRTPQEARSVLPNSTKTEVVMTANYREWRHVLELRCAKSAHPQMREVMLPLRDELRRRVPVLFDEVVEPAR